VSNNDGSSWSGTKHHQKSLGTASAAKAWLFQCGANALIGCLLSAADLFLRSLSILIHKQANHRTISTYCFHYLRFEDHHPSSLGLVPSRRSLPSLLLKPPPQPRRGSPHASNQQARPPRVLQRRSPQQPRKG
jgi:hypothetical protein